LDTNFRVFSLAKYTTQFKLEVVGRYLAGRIGFTAVAKLYGLDCAMLKRWVRLYQAHGEAGLAKKFTAYSAEQKMVILQHMWDKELSYKQAAAAFNIRSPGSVPSWERCYHAGGIDALKPRVRGRPKKMPDSQPTQAPLAVDDEARTREELQAEVNHLRMEVAYLKKLRALVQAQPPIRATARKKRK
jgi:transposase